MTTRVRDQKINKHRVFKASLDMLAYCINITRNNKYFPKRTLHQRSTPIVKYARIIKDAVYASELYSKYNSDLAMSRFNQCMIIASEALQSLNSEVDMADFNYDLDPEKLAEWTKLLDFLKTSLDTWKSKVVG